jgi:hypothetical protein
MMTRAQLLFVTLIATACWPLQAPSARAEGFDGKWTGTISCTKLSFTKGPFKVPIEMTVANGTATYARDVYNADGSRIVGTEEGKGMIGNDGRLTLTATWKSTDERPRYTYTASYAGRFNGNAAGHTGVELQRQDREPRLHHCPQAVKRGNS